jgi:probable addiction module antidote protein
LIKLSFVAAGVCSSSRQANDPDLLLLALGDVARVKGVAQVAKAAGLGRESLYEALAPGAKPRFETVMKVCVRVHWA